MTDRNAEMLLRYERQMIFPGLGLSGQRRLGGAKALIVGLGGLGSWTAELLARCGVGALRLVDDDKVDLTNLHRQALYGQAHAEAGVVKVAAAAERLGQINSQVMVEPIETRLDKSNVTSLADGCDLILDGTDNFLTRFIINDYAVRSSTPWIFAGVVSAEAQTMTIAPPKTPCLRCVFDSPPPACLDPACRTAGVIGPAVSAIASIQAAEAMKILAGRDEQISPYLLKIDLWDNSIQRVDVSKACRENDCPCCKGGHFDFIDDP